MSEQKFLDLHKFKKLQSIGSGGFSKVYLIRDPNTSQNYAAKVSNFMVNEKTYEQNETYALFREVNLIAMLDHPAILKFIGFSQTSFDDDPTPTIVTEYATNGSLFDIIELEKSGLSLNDWDDTKKLIIIYGIATGMSYLHAHKIIHRDLKPQNILINEFLHPKISDFGLSKINDILSGSLNVHSQKGIKGTPIYMAPEIFNEETYSEASDVYAFAFIVYEIFMLETPFKDFKFIEIMRKVTEGYRPQIGDFVPNFFRQLIENCWSQEPQNRPSFSDIVKDMKKDDSIITEMINELEFYDYIEFVDKYKSSFNSMNYFIQFEDFIKLHGRTKTMKKINIDKEEIIVN